MRRCEDLSFHPSQTNFRPYPLLLPDISLPRDTAHPRCWAADDGILYSLAPRYIARPDRRMEQWVSNSREMALGSHQ